MSEEIEMNEQMGMEEYRSPDVKLAGAITSLNPFKHNNSASRITMDAAHLAQAVVLEKPQPMLISSGVDFNYADHLFDIRIKGEPDELVRIIKVMKMYGRFGSEMNIDQTPGYYVIYENIQTGIIDVSVVPTYHYNHTTFGFKYHFTDRFKNLREGDVLESGTILAYPPGEILETGQYAFGRYANTAIGSFAEVAEDGFVISESFAKAMSTRRFGQNTVNYGTDWYLINLYGDEENYKPFPDIGEKIRDDGLIFALRKLDISTSPVMMTPKALMTVDYTFDKLQYGVPGATVEDVTVAHSHDPSKYYLPTGMKGTPDRYHQNATRRNRDLEALYRKLSAIKKCTLELSPELHHIMVEAMKTSSESPQLKLRRSNRMTYRKEEILQYRVTIVYSKSIDLEMGGKFSSCSGDKGVVVGIWPDEKMPLDAYGNRADVLADASSSIHRMNPGRIFEHHINGSLDQMRRYMDTIVDKNPLGAFDELLDYYQVLSPMHYNIVKNNVISKEDKVQHLHDFIDAKFAIIMPFGTVKTGTEHIKKLDEKYPLEYGPVQMLDENNEPFMTKENILISKMYMVRLEKIGENWASASVPKRQHHGIISKLSADTKHELPYRSQSIRMLGETELRILQAAATPVFGAVMVNMANNSKMCDDAIRSLLTADNPARIPQVVDYSKIQEYPSIAMERVKHLTACYGLRFEYEDESETCMESFPAINAELQDFEIPSDD